MTGRIARAIADFKVGYRRGYERAKPWGWLVLLRRFIVHVLVFLLVAVVVGVVATTVYLEYRGYCISEHTCTANYGANRK